MRLSSDSPIVPVWAHQCKSIKEYGYNIIPLLINEKIILKVQESGMIKEMVFGFALHMYNMQYCPTDIIIIIKGGTV